MEYNENNAPLSAADRAERWENATFFQKIALFFSEDFWQGFKEGFNETNQISDTEDDFFLDTESENDSLLTGIPRPDQHFHINHEMYHPELYD